MPYPQGRRPSDAVNFPHPGTPRQFGPDEPQLGRNVESNPTSATASMSSPARPAPPPPPPDQRARDSMRVAQDGRPGHDERLGLDQIPGYGRDPAQSERFRLEQEAEYVSNLHKVIEKLKKQVATLEKKVADAREERLFYQKLRERKFGIPEDEREDEDDG